MISSPTRTAGPYAGTGSQTVFGFNFKVFQASDVLVVQTDAFGNNTTLALTANYTVTLSSNQDTSPGGSVTLLVAPATGYQVTLSSQVPALQGANLTNAGNFYPSVINNALDYLTILVQQLTARVSNALQLPISVGGVSTTLPSPSGLALLGWNAAGTAIQNFAGTVSVAVSSFMSGVLASTDSPTARTALGLGSASTHAATDFQPAGSYAASGANNDITALAALSSVPAVIATAIAANPQSTVQGAFKNLQASANGTTAAVNVSADEIVLESAGHAYLTLRTVSLSANTAAASGVANSLDTGAWAFSTWYNVFVINGTSGTALLFSLSATAPTLPSGYTYFARVGAIRTLSATNYYPLAFKQYGRRVQYISAAGGAYPVMSSGAVGTINATTTTWAAVGVSAFVPPSAALIKVQLNTPSSGSGGSFIVVAPNNTQSGGWNAAIQPLFSNLNSISGVSESVVGDFILESTNIYVASAAAANFVACIGWEDNL